MKINGKIPGDDLKISQGEEVSISVEAFGHDEQIPLRNLEIIGHGEVLASASADDTDQSSEHLSIKMNKTIDQGIWIAARSNAGPAQVAHTTPIYISVDGGGFHNTKTIQRNLDTCEKYLNEIEEFVKNQSDGFDADVRHYKDKFFKRIADTREIMDALRMKLK